MTQYNTKCLLFLIVFYMSLNLPAANSDAKIIKISGRLVSSEELFKELEQNLFKNTNNLNKNEKKKILSATKKSLLQQFLKTHVEKKYIFTDLKKIVPEKLIAQRISEAQDESSNAAAFYKYYGKQVEAYRALDKLPKSEESVKKIFDEYFFDKKHKVPPGRPKDYFYGLWKGKAYNKNARDFIFGQYRHYGNIASGQSSEADKEAIRKELIILHPEIKRQYILKQSAGADPNVVKYLEKKRHSGEIDRKLEQRVINSWYLKQLEKMDCRLMTDKFGTLEEIMLYDAEDVGEMLQKPKDDKNY